jgi:molecular chaperone GrpE
MPRKKEQSINYQELAEQLAAENAQLNDAMLRERADAMNVRKRAEEEKLKLSGYYKSMVVRELLPTIDNFERAFKALPAELESNDYIKGIQGVVKQFSETLRKLGVERIKTVGEHFNPELHEAVTMEEGDGEHEVVSEELQSGYTMNGDVIRHAMVRVVPK